MSEPARIVAVVLILLGNAFFVGAEYALVTARRSRLRDLADRGSRRARIALELTAAPVRFVSTVQLGVTIFSILLGAVGAPLLEGFLEPLLATGLAFLIGFTVLTFMHVTLGELVPKAVALSRREEIALRVALPLRAFSLVSYPLVWLLEQAAGLATRPLGITLPPAGLVVESEKDIRLLVAEAEEAGVIEEGEEEMLYKVFDFAATEARDVMVPRPEIDALAVDASAEEALAEVAASRHSRYPVYGDSLDDLVGILNVYDLLAAIRERGAANVRLDGLTRAAFVVPETKDLGALLADLRRLNQPMAVVGDEYGATRGIVTLEDLFEEIVGEIADEYELPDETVVWVDERTLDVHGTYPTDDFNEQFGCKLPTEDYHTLAGFVFGRLGRAPAEGDEVVWDAFRFRVMRTEGARIKRLQVRIPQAAPVVPSEETREAGAAPSRHQAV